MENYREEWVKWYKTILIKKKNCEKLNVSDLRLHSYKSREDRQDVMCQ